MLSGDKASDNKGDQAGTLSWPQSVARTLVLNQLEKLPRGGLRIDEPDGNTVMLGSAVRDNNAYMTWGTSYWPTGAPTA